MPTISMEKSAEMSCVQFTRLLGLSTPSHQLAEHPNWFVRNNVVESDLWCKRATAAGPFEKSDVSQLGDFGSSPPVSTQVNTEDIVCHLP